VFTFETEDGRTFSFKEDEKCVALHTMKG